MKILVTGACGFVGSTLIRAWLESSEHEFIGLDNLTRPGSEVNRSTLKRLGVRVLHGDFVAPLILMCFRRWMLCLRRRPTRACSRAWTAAHQAGSLSSTTCSGQ